MKKTKQPDLHFQIIRKIVNAIGDEVLIAVMRSYLQEEIDKYQDLIVDLEDDIGNPFYTSTKSIIGKRLKQVKEIKVKMEGCLHLLNQLEAKAIETDKLIRKWG
jgi:hypothetical protein